MNRNVFSDCRKDSSVQLGSLRSSGSIIIKFVRNNDLVINFAEEFMQSRFVYLLAHRFSTSSLLLKKLRMNFHCRDLAMDNQQSGLDFAVI